MERYVCIIFLVKKIKNITSKQRDKIKKAQKKDLPQIATGLLSFNQL